mgnify:CR=1 FL=1
MCIRDRICDELAERFFLSDNDYLPESYEDYHLGYLDPDDWWPLVLQLTETSDMALVAQLAGRLDNLMNLPGVPTELLEDPLGFMESVLQAHLPLEPSGRRVGSRKLIKMAQIILEILKELPESARAAVRVWACLLYTSDAADDLLCVDLGGRRII